MAIILSSLIPIKEATGVLLTSAITFTLTSTVDDFKYDSVVFKINDVETGITYNFGVDQKELLFSRNLIDLQYGRKYVCTIEAETNSETFYDAFIFYTENGNLKNQLIPDYYYYQTCQDLANGIPETQKARYDRYSNFQQFLNKFAAQVEEFNHTIIRHAANSFIQTANLNDLNTLYKVELPGNFEFNTVLLDDGTSLYKPPLITAQSSIHNFEVLPNYDNDLFTFYYKKIPDRIEITSKPIINTEIFPITDIGNLEILIDHECEVPSGFVIEIIGGNRFASLPTIFDLKLLNVRIKGKSNFNNNIEETLSITRNGPFYSSRSWSYIESIEFYNFPKNFSGQFKIDRFPLKRTIINDFYEYADLEEVRSLSWGLRTEAGKTFLQCLANIHQDALQFVRDPSQEVVREYQLFDIDNITNIELIDFTIDEYYEYIYGVDSNYLYIFNKLEEYPLRLEVMKSASSDPLTVIELQADERGTEGGNKEVTFRAVQSIIDKKIISYRFKLIKPDGTLVGIDSDGNETVDYPWISVSRLVSDFRSQPIYYQITEPGDYYLYLEVRYENGGTDRDIKIIRMLKKSALAKYKLEKFIDTNIPDRIFFDFDQKLKILDQSDNLYTIKFFRDNVLIDYENKVLYFNEQYDEVDIT